MAANMFDAELCREVHKNLEDKIQVQNLRLCEHSKSIDSLKQYQAKSEERLGNLCKSLDKLVSTLWWFMAAMFTTLLGFFIWVTQQGLVNK